MPSPSRFFVLATEFFYGDHFTIKSHQKAIFLKKRAWSAAGAWLLEITKKFKRAGSQAKVVRKVDNTINRIDHYPVLVCNLPKLAFKKSIRNAIFAALEGDEDYTEAPNLLFKINLYFP